MATTNNHRSDVRLPSEGAVDDRNNLDSQMISTIDTSPITHMIVSQTREHLIGMEYPASKVGLFRYAQKTGASEIVLQALDKLPPRSFRSLAHVIGAMKIFSKPGPNPKY